MFKLLKYVQRQHTFIANAAGLCPEVNTISHMAKCSIFSAKRPSVMMSITLRNKNEQQSQIPDKKAINCIADKKHNKITANSGQYNNIILSPKLC